VAFGSGVALGTAQSKSAGTSLALTVGFAVSAGALVVVVFAGDNTATSDGNTSPVTSVVDSAGNSYRVAHEFSNAQGGAASGAAVAVYYSVITSTLSSGVATITVNHASIAARAITAESFAIASGKTVNVSAANQIADDGATSGSSLAISGLSNIERLYIRAMAVESATAGSQSTAPYTDFSTNGTSGGGGATNMAVSAAYRIVTGTGDTYDPGSTTGGTSADIASVYVALEEANPPVGPSIPIIMCLRRQRAA
jgi:hypothetical protein